MLALRFGWLKTDIDRQDPDFIDELIARINAEPKPKKRRGQAPRRGRRSVIEDVDL